MADRRTEPDSLLESEVPAALVDSLAALHRVRAIDVPQAVDASILRDARAGYARRRRFWVAARAAGAGAAVAAAALVVLVVYLDRERPAPSPVVASQSTREGDVDENGRVDILDAFWLARKVRANPRALPERVQDVNRDDAVDQRDVDYIASIAVRVDAKL